jgi:hypothetical protein
MTREESMARHPAGKVRQAIIDGIRAKMQQPADAGPEGAPIEIVIHWCPKCDSRFIHDLGSRHIRQNAVGGECNTKLIALQFYR